MSTLRRILNAKRWAGSAVASLYPYPAPLRRRVHVWLRTFAGHLINSRPVRRYAPSQRPPC